MLDLFSRTDHVEGSGLNLKYQYGASFTGIRITFDVVTYLQSFEKKTPVLIEQRAISNRCPCTRRRLFFGTTFFFGIHIDVLYDAYFLS